ncbi:hypothetical protein COMNV_00126 [Commensalibacter sp. Nvir]|uniref:hypothetical protein n=1 Tax=Commensalibacter sp. Nvir TaxID=3069817 RepID=UPI002D6E179A|nr:hypothetical protein COMNV_00126 [Commensalibacter sp. Nvir]
MPVLVNLTHDDKVNTLSWLNFINVFIGTIKRNFIVSRAGHTSLHMHWPYNIDFKDCNENLCISWYNRNPSNVILEYEYFAP